MNRRDRSLHAESMLKALLQSMDQAAVVKSVDGTIILWNRAAAELFGYTAPEIIGENADILVPPEDLQPWRECEKRLRGGGVVRRVGVVRIAQSGKQVRARLTTVLIDKSQAAQSEILEMYDRLPRSARVTQANV